MKRIQPISLSLLSALGIVILAFCCCNRSSLPDETKQKKIDSLFQALQKEKARRHFILDSMKILRERDSVMNLLELERLKVAGNRSFKTTNAYDTPRGPEN